jgi:excisionase family DNA binding protein
MPNTLTHKRGVIVYDAARILQLPESTVRSALQYETLRATRVDGRVRISLDELEKYRRHRDR